jgi:hypothetical protein
MMLISGMILALYTFGQMEIEPAHRGNLVFEQVLKEGLKVGAHTLALPAPRLRDGQDAGAERASVEAVAGSAQRLEEMFRDSVTAPYIMQVHDQKLPDGTIRAADVWFVVYADLSEVHPAREAERTDQKEVEVGNMWFQSRLLKPDELRAAGKRPQEKAAGMESWYAHLHARLLDRIEIEATNHVMATQSSESIVVASRTDAAFANGGPSGNRWKSLSPAEGGVAQHAAHPYEGGISYAKLSRVKFKPGAILVEMHMAFVEPAQWFQGAPILRSKFSVAAQDQIRRLRREIARSRNKKKSSQ